MGRACSMNGGKGMHIGHLLESQKERNHSEEKKQVGSQY
jgi:hypothetical protein